MLSDENVDRVNQIDSTVSGVQFVKNALKELSLDVEHEALSKPVLSVLETLLQEVKSSSMFFLWVGGVD